LEKIETQAAHTSAASTATAIAIAAATTHTIETSGAPTSAAATAADAATATATAYNAHYHILSPSGMSTAVCCSVLLQCVAVRCSVSDDNVLLLVPSGMSTIV